MKSKPTQTQKAIIFLWVVMILLVQPARAEDPFKVCRDENPDWYVCESDSDCIITSNPCGWPVDAVNKAHSAGAEKCNISDVGSALSCPSYDKVRDGVFHAICQSEECVAIPDSKE